MIRTITRRQALSISLALPAAFLSGRSLAQTFPGRPIRLIVGGAAGSVPDTLARVVADRLSLALGQPVLVENRPGAGGTLAIISMIASEPDGHHLALATMSQAVFNSYLYSNSSLRSATGPGTGWDTCGRRHGDGCSSGLRS